MPWAPAFTGVADLIRAMVRHCLMNRVNDSEHLAACSEIAYDCGNSAVLPACREFSEHICSPNVRAEDAPESALAMYVAAEEPLPTSSEAEADEVMVPLFGVGDW